MGERTVDNHANTSLTGMTSAMQAELARARESGVWPVEYLDALLGAVESWATTHATTYHHTGYTFPTKEAFDAAFAAAEAEHGPILANDMVTPGGVTHFRRYVRVAGTDGQPDAFVELHRVGEYGNGVTGIHLDFVTDDPQRLLQYIRNTLPEDVLDTAQVVVPEFGTPPFSGGMSPIGKVDLMAADDKHHSVGVMARSYWSDPADW